VILLVHTFARKVTVITVDAAVGNGYPDARIAPLDIPGLARIDVGVDARVLPGWRARVRIDVCLQGGALVVQAPLLVDDIDAAAKRTFAR
jgi:hypothetical protein